MSPLLGQIQTLIADGDVLVSLHGLEELEADNIRIRDAVKGVATTIVVEEYPDYAKGPCVLVLDATIKTDRFTSSGAFRPVGSRLLFW